MRLLRAADRVAMPWKNGLGLTREIAVHPPGAGMADFDWRLSMAAVDAGGTFSSFPDVDRTLMVLSGTLFLMVGAEDPVRLDPNSEPCRFPGDVATDSMLLAGPVVDLNVMVRRGKFTARVTRLTGGGATPLVSEGTHILFVRDGAARITSGDVLMAGDALLYEGGAFPMLAITLDADATAFLIELRKLG